MLTNAFKDFKSLDNSVTLIHFSGSFNKCFNITFFNSFENLYNSLSFM